LPVNRQRDAVAVKNGLVFFGGKIHPAKKHEIMVKPPQAPTGSRRRLCFE
jgi:hypothetical protein